MAIVPQKDDIVFLRNERFTYVSEALSYDSSLGLWEILDDQGEAFIVYFVQQGFDMTVGAPFRLRNEWSVTEI